MIPKDVGWSVLAQCDFFAVEELVQTPERLAMQTVKPMRKSVFETNLRKDIKWRETYDSVLTAYQSLGPKFAIKYDSFGGYRLLYFGEEIIRPPHVFRRNPIGFIREVPDGVATDLSVMSSRRTGKQLILLGPMRFVNSDCDPNCEYDFSSELGIIQLRVKRRILPGDEILVKYGPDFFEFNACRCRTCQIRIEDELRNSIIFDDLFNEIVNEVVVEVQKQSLIQISSPSVATNSSFIAFQRRLKGRELVEHFNALIESPPSGRCSPLIVDESRQKTKQISRPLVFHRNDRKDADSEDGDDDNGDDVGDDDDDDGDIYDYYDMEVDSNDSGDKDDAAEDGDSDDNDDEGDVSNDNRNAISIHKYDLNRDVNSSEMLFDSSGSEVELTGETNLQRASSPIDNKAIYSFSLSAIGEDIIENTATDPLHSTQYDEKLFHGTETTVQEASDLTELFCSRFSLSDECSSSLHTLIRVLLPDGNTFPSGYSHVNGMKKQFEDGIRFLHKNDDSSLCVLNFRFQIRDVIRRNLSQINQYTDVRKKYPNSDLNQSLCPLVEINTLVPSVLNLILSSDGVNIKKSTFKKELWPIWVQIADLPPKLRMARKNIVLAALFVGSTYPDWKFVLPFIRDEMSTGIHLTLDDELSYKFFFKVRLLICDLGAKSHMLNMLKFNGFFGCHVCTAKGKTIGRTHAYYPYREVGSLREQSVNNVYIDIAETLGAKRKPNVVGVKGESAFSMIIDGLPLTAPIDYMHCVMLGVFPDLLKLCYKTLNARHKTEICDIIEQLSCPREMISYSRKIRPLEEMSQFKANEYFNWMFYLSPIIFRGRLPEKFYSHLTNLVFGVRLLHELSSETNVSCAGKLLNLFCQQVVSMHDGNERIETINVHCLRHLAEQVRRFGALFCQSAMCFESANRTLGDVFSGATSECEVICRRILQRHKLFDAEVKNKKLKPLYYRLTGKQEPETEEKCYTDEFFETDAVKKAKLSYRTAKFSNRRWVRNCYFDSPAYKRSKLGNCYVWINDEDDHELFGEIQFFIEIPSSSQTKNLANVVLFSKVDDIGPVKGFFYRVRRTTLERFVPTEHLRKVFLIDNIAEYDKKFNEYFVVKLTANFEHS